MSFYPGKVIITGEHSVVYGYKAVLSALSLGVTCVAQPSKGISEKVQNDLYLRTILQICARELNIPNLVTDVCLKISSTLPAKSGLGSSAAVAAASIAAVFDYYHRPFDTARLYKLVVEAEQFVHGRSSGADPSIVVHGGSLVFQQGAGLPLSNAFLEKQTFAILDSGPAIESTGEMVALVASHPQRSSLITSIGQVSEEISVRLSRSEYPVDLIRQNHLLLTQLGVVGQKAFDSIERLWQLGVVSKITGAGGVIAGSGSILAWHEDPAFLMAQTSALAVPVVYTRLGQSQRKTSYETTQ